MATPTRQHHHQRKKGSVASVSKEGAEPEAEPERENLW
jgi:hypothetical protein